MRILKKNEYELNNEEKNQLQNLLKKSFPDFFENRIYNKQLPHFRFLGIMNEELVAQIGIDYRVIKVGDEIFDVFGIIDLCVKEENRGQGLAEKLLNEVHSLAKSNDVDFVVLFADDHRVYNKIGFQLKENSCKWLGIDEHTSLSIIEEKLDSCLMIKSVSGKEWKNGELDMLGYLY